MMTPVKHLRRLVRDELGQDLVELTIVTPLMLLVVFAIIEFGSLFDHRQTMAYLTREGANIASRGTAIDEVLDITMDNGDQIQLADRGGVVVSRLEFQDSEATIVDQVASPGFATASHMGGTGEEVSSMGALNLADGVAIHVVEVFYEPPRLTPLEAFFYGSLPDVLYDRAIF